MVSISKNNQLLIISFFMFLGNIFTVTPAYSNEQWICLAEMSSGFIFRDGIWSTTTFHANDKYIISNDKFLGYLTVKQIGEERTKSHCNDGFKHCVGDSCFDTDILSCSGFYDIKFSKVTLKYQLYFQGQYFGSDDSRTKEKWDTPFLEIGRCSPL